MRTEYPACSEADSAPGNRRVEAPWSEPASRSASETKRASLHKVRTANLSDMPKPEIRREEIFTSNGGVLRGRRGQRAGKVGLGRLGDPGHRHREQRCESGSESISCRLEAGKSERPVVAMKSRSSRDGAKGPWQERNGLKKSLAMIGGSQRPAHDTAQDRDWRAKLSEQAKQGNKTL